MKIQVHAKNRISWIDIAKAIGILIVLINHAELPLGVITYLGGMFYMPVFFVLSGYTFKESRTESVFQFVKSKAKRLLIPYACFQILLAGMFTIKNILAKQTVMQAVFPLLGALYSRNALYPYQLDTFVKIPADNVNFFTARNAPLWFLTGLFVSLVIYKFILSVAKQNIKQEFIYTGISIFAGVLLKYFCPILLPWSMDTALISVGFLHLGRCLKREEHFLQLIKKPLWILGIILIFITTSYINGSVNMSMRGFGKSVILYLVVGGTGSICVMLLSKAIEDYCKRLMSLFVVIGRHTIGILALHSMIFVIIEYLFLLLNIQGDILEKVAKVLLSVVILVPADWFIQKYLPFVYGITRRNK
jgi:acyltransferase